MILWYPTIRSSTTCVGLSWKEELAYSERSFPMRKLLSIVFLCAGLLVALNSAVFAGEGKTGGTSEGGNIPVKHCKTKLAADPGETIGIPGNPGASITNNGTTRVKLGSACDGCPGTEWSHPAHSDINVPSGSSVTLNGLGPNDHVIVNSNSTVTIEGGPLGSIEFNGTNITMIVDAFGGGTVTVKTSTSSGSITGSNTPEPTPSLNINLNGSSVLANALTGNIKIYNL